ncbi:MAG: hypothetical protein PHV23_05150 [Candidatus Gracilibacteria bacterium]|nr:hypothetical protein [Candidatus Gracilibacteria bacterium]
MSNIFTAIGLGLLTLLSLGATVSSDALVSVDATEVSALGTGIANMAQSFISVGMQLLPLILPLLAVFLIFGFVKGFVTRRG